MVRIRGMGMSVRDRTVVVPMSVRFACRIAWLVMVLMVLIVDVRVGVSHRKMHMSMITLHCKMQPNTQRHKATGCE